MFRKMIFSGAALAALCVAGPVAYASPPTKFDLGSPIIIFDVCTGENISFVGTNTLSIAFAVQNDIIHVQDRVSIHDKGTGLTSGAEYVLNNEDIFEQNAKLVNGTSEFTLIENVSLVGKGAVANESVKLTEHVTVNANGTVTVSRADFDLTCHK